MPKFSASSLGKLATCDPRIQRACKRAIRIVDFTIVTGHRGEQEQVLAYKSGYSRVTWPGSKHNSLPSTAVDVAPYPKLYTSSAAEFSYVAGIIVACASADGLVLRWGGDWNGNLDTTDQKLHDWGHLEILE